MSAGKVAVIGAGTMGHGIAQVFACAGYQVAITDSNPRVAERAFARIEANLSTLCARGSISAERAAAVPSRIESAASIESASSGADLVIEAVVEDLGVKRQVLRQVEAACPAEAIIASNTSSFRVRDMASVLSRSERFLVTHWWNPPYIVPAVEVVSGAQTSSEALAQTVAYLKRAGKYPVVVKKDGPGFVGNRLQHALRREAIAIVAEGIASAEDVDLITKLSFGLRLPVSGPLETVDLGGLDLTLSIQEYLLPKLDRSTEPRQLLRDKIARGELGAKAGEGFFKWDPGEAEKRVQERDEALLDMITWLVDQGVLPRDLAAAHPVPAGRVA